MHGGSHCAAGGTGARVTATGAGGKTSTVARIFRYAQDPKSDPAVQNDLAILILRTPIRLGSYPAVQLQHCYGCSVVHAYRSERGAGRTALASTPVVRLAGQPTSANPLALYAPVKTGDSGGAAFRAGVTVGGRPIIVGIMLGGSHKGEGSYVSRLDDPEVQVWLKSTLAYARTALPTTATGTHTQTEGDPGTNPDPSANPDTPTPEGSTPNPEPTVNAPPTDQSDPSQAPAAPAGDTVDKGGVPTSPAPAGDGPTEVDSAEPGLVNVPAAGCPAGSSCTSNTPTPGGGTCNATFGSGDGFGSSVLSYCASSSSSASIVGCHGFPGLTAGCANDPDALAAMGARANADPKSPIILASCNGGTPDESVDPNAPNFSNAGDIARTAGTSPRNVYACCGGLVTALNGMQCGGAWCDGAGFMLQSEVRDQYNLKNCKMTASDCTNGKPGCVVLSNCY